MKLKIYDRKGLLESLYDEYVSDIEFTSTQTSSHWKKFGSMTLIKKISKSRYELSGAGFGDYLAINLYNILKNIPTKIILHNLIKKLDPSVKDSLYSSCKKSNRIISFDCVKHALSVNKLISLGINFENKKICIIGDGYGFLGILLKQHFPNVKIISVNLGKVLFFDAAITALASPSSNIKIATSKTIKDDADFEFIPAEILDTQSINDIDIFFNISSMQEMNLTTISRYMNWIREQKKDLVFFYCCNRISKILPDSTVINFKDYGWKSDDTVILDEECNWYQSYPINVPPFSQKFDGPIHHKLIMIQNGFKVI